MQNGETAEQTTRLKDVLDALRDLRCGPMVDEYALQDKIEQALTSAAIAFEKERRLGKGMRVDFLTAGGIAIEVKKGKPTRWRVLDQIERYAQSAEVAGVLIVVETGLRNQVELTGNGKPCHILGLSKLWGIAL